MEKSNNQPIVDFLLANKLGAFPLFTILGGKCSCKRPGCQSPGKHPFYRTSWKKSASGDEAKLRTWFQDDKFNFAVPTGKWSSSAEKFLVVIDVDQAEHPIMEKLPRTFSYETGSGGHHFWYWSAFPIANSVSKLAPSVDVRGDNGYVVIPPSRHASGKSYRLHESQIGEIADLPGFVLEALDRKNLPSRKKSSPRVGQADGSLGAAEIPQVPVQDIAMWTSGTIADLRSFLDQGKKIPMGTRNNVIHRLLSSDRAKGLSEKDLWSRAQGYIDQCSLVEHFPISDFEIRATISQVLKYKSYNTSFENVNTNFFEFMDRSKTGPMSNLDKECVLLADSQFFESLTPSPCERGEKETHWVSLEHVAQQRNLFFSERQVRKHSRYPLPLLAKKLESLGFCRKRTNKGNLWNVEFSLPIIDLNKGLSCGILKGTKESRPHRAALTPLLGKQLNMTMNVDDYDQKKIMVKINKHPSEPRYCGRVNRDSGDALMKLMAILTVPEREQLLAGTFIQDEEGTAEEFDAMLPGDRVGIVLSFDDGWAPTQLEITSIEADSAKGKDLFTETEVEFTFEDVSAARAMGYFEILYRPDPANAEKLIPFGIEREREVTLLIPKEPPAPPPGASAAPIAEQPALPLVPLVPPVVQPPAAPAAPVQLPMPSLLGQVPPTLDELTAILAGTGTSAEGIKAIAEGMGIDITAKGPVVPARGRQAENNQPSADSAAPAEPASTEPANS